MPYEYCKMCGSRLKEQSCSDCDVGDHNWQNSKQEHCTCCHLDTRITDDEVNDALASIRDAITRGSRGVGSPS